jgi:phosphoglycerate dehydrogenase-like enzyme
MLDVVVLDKDAAIYAEAIRAALPDARVRPAVDEDAAVREARDAEVIVALAHAISRELVAAAPRLKFIQALTTGTDHLETLDLPADIAIASARGIHGPQMAELAFLYMLSLSRDFIGMHANQRRRRWERWPQRLLLGKTIALIGVGAISEDLAARAKAFGMRVVGVSDARASAPDFERIWPRAQFAEAVADVDFVVVLAPLNASTRHMIDASFLAAMPRGAVLINLARGPVVDETALIASLRSGHLGGAGLDVFGTEPLPTDSVLWDMPNVIVTPHIGGMSDVYAHQVLPLVIDNLSVWRSSGAAALRNRVTRG